MTSAPAYLVKGTDPSLVGIELRRLLDSIGASAAAEGGVHIEEHWPGTGSSGGSDAASEGEGASPEDGGSRGRIDLGPVLDACLTAPFLTARRVVVVRRAGSLDAAQSKRLAKYLAEAMPSTTLVLCADDTKVSASLEKAVLAVGEVRDSTVGTGGARRSFIDSELKLAGLKLDKSAKSALDDRLGDDVARLPGLLAAVAASATDDKTLGLDEIEAFLGQAGAGAPWDLTDAIDAGDTEKALDHLHRLVEGGERHPLVVLSILHRHFGGMLALDGASVDDAGAARILGMKPYPAGKVLRQARKLGSERVGRAMLLLAEAELDLRGRSDLQGELVLEILVARFAYIARESGGKRESRRR